MAKLCLLINLTIYASGFVASESQREDGSGALSKEEPCKPSGKGKKVSAHLIMNAVPKDVGVYWFQWIALL